MKYFKFLSYISFLLFILACGGGGGGTTITTPPPPPPPIATSLSAGATSIVSGASTTLTPIFSNGTGVIGTTEGGSQVAVSVTSGSPITISPTSSTTYYLTVTNSVGVSASISTTIVVFEPDGFKFTSSMARARVRSSATLLPNSKVLVVGGETSTSGPTSNITSSAELYDPSTGTWASTGSMSVSRTEHTATLLSNGKVLVVGGYDQGSRSSCELYDPSTGTWASTGSMLNPRDGHTATLLSNGKVLVVGGQTRNNTSNTFLSSAELYDPSTGTWASTGSMSVSRTEHTATLLSNGKVLVVGGGNGTIDVLSSTQFYDPVTGIWSSAPSLNLARRAHTATLLQNGKVLVVGGYSNGFANYHSSVELYDDDKRIWEAAVSLSVGRATHTATLLSNGKVLIAGGYGTNKELSSAQFYDPSTGTWATLNPMKAARSLHLATRLNDGRILIIGGWYVYGAIASVELGSVSSISTPVATSLTAASTAITAGGSTTLTPVFSGGSGKIGTSAGGSQITTNATSGSAIVISPTVSTTYYLTVTNASGSFASNDEYVTVIPAPVATSLTAASTAITAGGSTTLTPVFSGGSGKIGTSAGGSQITTNATSGSAIVISPTVSTTYYLTVTNSLGVTASTSTNVTVTFPQKSLGYTDPIVGTYRWIKNISLSTNNHLVLDLVATDSQLVSGIAFTMTIDTSKATWSKVNSSDSYFIQNGTVFNIGVSTPIFYSNLASINAILTAAVAQKGSMGVPVNGSSTVLARIAIDPVNSGTIGSINLTPIRAQINIQGIAKPSSITVYAGTLTLQ